MQSTLILSSGHYGEEQDVQFQRRAEENQVAPEYPKENPF